MRAISCGKEKEREKGREGDDEGGEGHREETCYALREMAEACGIHNFVKTKMLRWCLSAD